MRQQLSDYGLMLDHIPIRCDNTSAINLSKNPILHSRTKHIEIRHHFLRDHVQKGDCVLELLKQRINWPISLPSLYPKKVSLPLEEN